MTRRDIAIRDASGEVAALVTITPMHRDGHDLADDARELLVEEFDGESTPVTVQRDE